MSKSSKMPKALRAARLLIAAGDPTNRAQRRKRDQRIRRIKVALKKEP